MAAERHQGRLVGVRACSRGASVCGSVLLASKRRKIAVISTTPRAWAGDGTLKTRRDKVADSGAGEESLKRSREIYRREITIAREEKVCDS